MREIINNIIGFFKKVSDDDISGYSAQGAYYMLLSMVPMIALMLTFVKFTPIDFETANKIILGVVPTYFRDFANSIIEQIYNNTKLSMSFSVIILLWSASKAMRIIIDGFNRIYGTEDNISYIKKLVYAFLYTLIIVIFVPIILTISIAGRHFLGMVVKFIGIMKFNSTLFFLINLIFTSFVMFIMILAMYRFIPKTKIKFRNVYFGAIFSTVIGEIFSSLFSIYIDFTIKKASIYGGFNIIILLMLWFYSMIFIILLGCEINKYYFSKKVVEVE